MVWIPKEPKYKPKPPKSNNIPTNTPTNTPMNREEAIRWTAYVQQSEPWQERVIEALDIAIEALKAQDRPIICPRCGRTFAESEGKERDMAELIDRTELLTREEAIKVLNEYGTLFPSDKSEAIDMAIEALKREDKILKEIERIVLYGERSKK